MKEIKEKVIKEVEEQKARELKGKDRVAQKAIQEKYKQQKQAILALDDQVINEGLEYIKGLLNRYAHNTLGIALKDAKNGAFINGNKVV